MTYERIKKALLSVTLAGTFILSTGFAASSVASAQGRDWRRQNDRQSEWDRRQEREELDRIRRSDREHQLRYRTSNSQRVVGYYDRSGRFHAQGFYDRLGRFHRY